MLSVNMSVSVSVLRLGVLAKVGALVIRVEQSGGTYLANWLSVGNRVGGLCCFVAAEEMVRHECGTQRLDHQVVVV